ncbi:glycosyltransferase [Mucilaginibacter sp. E4BP6]|uniref:glycosyltransferase n=1 Tax=Mucilaginibacter sp. E4BP6 TaxID=2723089 RepID=UPI0015C718A8|nr:glycosyltransferase [Mucilaginibacter sp. E4BP6]NYE67908.1 rhamnosyltransferase [Mucilaginibacter sp. E4BP6]
MNIGTENSQISILIPTLNAGSAWVTALQAISLQTLNAKHKIIVDSGSTDDTVEIAKSFGFKVVSISKHEFNHGATRQLLVELAKDAAISIFLTQDAILASPNSIENIVKAFDNPMVGIAYGRQLPHENAKPLETHARFFNYPDDPEIVSIADIDKKGFKVFFCSNSFSAYRHSALLDVGGFPSNSIMGEDAIVAAKMLKQGFKKAYVADAAVYHSHTYTLIEEFRRYFDTRVFHEQNRWLIENYGKPTGEGLKFVKSELKYISKNDPKYIFKSIGSLGAKWLGYKAGKYYRTMPLSLIKRLSMHKHFWK